jgi:hypothetical protein
MWSRKNPPNEVLAFAEANGWTVQNYLPDRYSACTSIDFNEFTVILTQNANSGQWNWLADPGLNYSRGHQRGTGLTFDQAREAAMKSVNVNAGTLF